MNITSSDIAKICKIPIFMSFFFFIRWSIKGNSVGESLPMYIEKKNPGEMFLKKAGNHDVTIFKCK